MLLALMMIGISQAHLVVNKIATNNGYIEINRGKVEIVKYYDTIIHKININEIELIINQLEENIISQKFDNDKKIILELEIIRLRSKLHTIVPHRQRRGLINFVGKIHKWLYGTMDNEDRENIEKQLDFIETNNHNIIENVNKQVKINNNFNESFVRLKETLENDRTKIIDTYNSVSSQYKNLISHTSYIDYLLKIKIFHDNLEHIQDNVASSRSGIIHSNILTPEEIEQYNIDIHKLMNIKIGSFYSKSNNLIFVILVPRETIIIDKMMIFPITNNNQEELLFEPEEIIRYNNKTYNFVSNKEISKLRLSNNCIITNNCMKILNNVSEIIEIETGIVIIKNSKNMSLSNNCKQKVVTLNGNYLLQFRNCTIELDNHVFYNHQKEFKQTFVIPQPETNIKELNKKLTFDELILNQVQNTKEIIELRYHRNTNIVINSTIVIITIVLLIIVIISAKRKGFKVKLKFKKTQESLQSKEGGVTSGLTQQPTIKSSSIFHVPPVSGIGF